MIMISKAVDSLGQFHSVSWLGWLAIATPQLRKRIQTMITEYSNGYWIHVYPTFGNPPFDARTPCLTRTALRPLNTATKSTETSAR